jgi:hypothetical protein
LIAAQYGMQPSASMDGLYTHSPAATTALIAIFAPTSGYKQNIIIAAIDRWMAAKTRQ